MPITRIDAQPLPYVRPAYEPDTRTLRELMAMAGAANAASVGRRAQARAAGVMTLGELVRDGIQSYQDGRDRKAALQAAALKQQSEDVFKQRDQDIRAAEAAARIGERDEALALRREATERQTRADQQALGDRRAKAIGYGPMAESDVDLVLQSPERGGDVRYVFGDGTANGPELMPTPEQRRGIQTDSNPTEWSVLMAAAGGDPRKALELRRQQQKPDSPSNPTEWSVLMAAAGGDPRKALELRRQQQNASNVVNQPERKIYIRNGRTVPLSSAEIQPGDVPYSADAMQGMGGEASDVRSSRVAAALNSIDKLKSLAPKRLPGLPGMAQGVGEQATGFLGYNTNARQFSAMVEPTAMQMAVAIQGAAGLSNSEREAMSKMLGSISTMDYESQMALLENASEMIRGGADVALVTVKDPKTGQAVDRWVPKRNRLPGSVMIDTDTVTGSDVDREIQSIRDRRRKGGGR